jgi:hypothetical protein
VIIDDLASNLYHHVHPRPEFLSSELFTRIEHQSYVYAAGYRNEDRSIVGYWAETVIFGGPILFAKGFREMR